MPPAAKAIDLELEEIEVLDDRPEETSGVMQSPLSLGPKPADLRAMLAEQPELLGLELCVITGKQDGVCFPTDVGEIDLLLVDDETGSLIVVSIPEPDATADPISEILQ
jgi:hypothetical protein